MITDMIMPNLNGVQVTQRLRALDADLPIFVLTGHADMTTAIEALKAGANEYLTKPVNIDELTTLLTADVLARHRGPADVELHRNQLRIGLDLAEPSFFAARIVLDSAR